MAGLGEILAENERLRELARAHEAERAAWAEERATWVAQQAESEAKLEAVIRRAEQLAYALEMLQLRKQGPASKRFVPDTQEAFAFTQDAIAPPRLAEPDPHADPSTEPLDTRRPRRRTRGKPKRRNLSENTTLPRQTRRFPAAEQPCAGCGAPLKVIGEATSSRVEWVEGHFVIHEVIRDKCACSQCPQEGVLSVPHDYALPRALCGNGLLARVLVDKFADHLPLNRQARRMGREGVDIPTNTISGWVGAAAGLARPIAEAIWRDVAQSPVLLADDTGHPIQDGGNGALRRGRLWVYTDQQQAVYRFSPTKEGEHPVAALHGFTGQLLLVDGGSEFNAATEAYGLERGGCWSHLRTYFHDALPHHPAEAELALGTLQDLFMLEREFAGREPEEVLQLRQQHSQRLVDGLFAWMRGVSTTVRPESPLATALRYGLNQESRLRKFLQYGELPLHNNLSELLLRQPVVGRKNGLFSRTEGGAEGAAILYTLVGSCFLQGIDPFTYVVDVLGRLDEPPTQLTPKAWKIEQKHAAGMSG